MCTSSGEDMTGFIARPDSDVGAPSLSTLKATISAVSKTKGREPGGSLPFHAHSACAECHVLLSGAAFSRTFMVLFFVLAFFGFLGFFAFVVLAFVAFALTFVLAAFLAFAALFALAALLARFGFAGFAARFVVSERAASSGATDQTSSYERENSFFVVHLTFIPLPQPWGVFKRQIRPGSGRLPGSTAQKHPANSEPPRRRNIPVSLVYEGSPQAQDRSA